MNGDLRKAEPSLSQQICVEHLLCVGTVQGTGNKVEQAKAGKPPLRAGSPLWGSVSGQAGTLQRAVPRETGPAGPAPALRLRWSGKAAQGSDVYTATWPDFTAEAEGGILFVLRSVVKIEKGRARELLNAHVLGGRADPGPPLPLRPLATAAPCRKSQDGVFSPGAQHVSLHVRERRVRPLM